MKNTVSFETAKRLKEAGFPQPEFEFGQLWHTDGDRDCAFVGTMPFVRMKQDYAGSIIFLPTATDILLELQAVSDPNRWWALIPLSGDPKWEWVLQLWGENNNACIANFFNKNAAEAAAAAWLNMKK